MVSASIDAQIDLSQLPDLTGKLKLVRIAGTGSFSVVYHCLYYAQSMDVAVKAITFPPNFHPTKKEEFMRKVGREFAIWKRLQHPNIVPLLGIVCDSKEFGSELPCIASRWMTKGTLFEYMHQFGTKLSRAERVQLIKGSAAGVEYLHSQGIIHGHLHPGNILIDDVHNPRLIDFALRPGSDQLSLGPVLWTAPESLYPDLYLKLGFQATLQNDIYPLGSVMLFILSGQYPWQKRGEAENKLKEFQNPPRPVWPANIPDGVWDFIERCWSPRDPGNRPSAEEVLSFSTERLEKLYRPNPASDVNVVLFGALGSGKSSLINLLAEKEVAQISSGVEPCTMGPRSYQISIDGNQVRLWDTMGFFLAHGPNHLLPYEQAHAVLRNLSQGVNLIIICAPKGIITPSLRRLYWLINDFFYGGRAPIAFVVTHFDTPDKGWWERNERDIAQRTSIPVQSIPHACVTTDPTGYLQSKHALKELLQNYATTVPPIPLRQDLSSYMTASLDLVSQCRLTSSEAAALVKTFRGPLPVFNVVFFGDTGAGTSEIVNLIAGHPGAETSPGAITYARSYRLSMGMQQLRIWDPMGVDKVHTDHGSYMGGLENACRLVRDLADEDGVDLLVFCKRCGRLTAEEISGYRLVEEILCKGRSPVAVVVTHVESRYPAEKWWEMNGKDLVKSIGGNVIGHSCTPSLAHLDDSLGIEPNEMRAESRLSIEAMLEDCVCSRNAGLARAKSYINLLPKALRKYAAYRKKMTVEILMARCGFTRGQAERLVQSINGTIFG